MFEVWKFYGTKIYFLQNLCIYIYVEKFWHNRQDFFIHHKLMTENTITSCPAFGHLELQKAKWSIWSF